jgi:glycosyltransferase involved in cell wall biosynthesis
MSKRILSTLETWSKIPAWAERVDSLALTRSEGSGRFGALSAFAIEVYNGARLWWLSRSYDAVVTDSRVHTSVFGLLERLCPSSKRRHLMFECLWERPDGRLMQLLKTLQFRAALTPRSRGIVYARRERTSFSACFGIRGERFVFIPYHTTLRHFNPSDHGRPIRDRYVFAGGDTHRDYRVLCEAVSDLNIRVVIAVRKRKLLEGIRIPANVQIITTDHWEFLRWMQHAEVNVVPLEDGTLRSAGQQTFLNAMALGTVVVVTDEEGGGDYIQNWVDGVLVEAANPAALRSALCRVLADPELGARIRANAARTGTRYATERILRLCIDYLEADCFDDPSCREFLPHDRGETR